jgi:hypothetical protein
MWVTRYRGDVESDFSVLHRVDDPFAMDGPRFFRLAVRLPYYQGAMHVVALGLIGEQNAVPSTEGGRNTRSVAGGSDVRVNLPDKGPSELPAGWKYTDSDPGSLMANPAFADKFTFATAG